MKKGFTLVELAIVLIVIGLLLGMAFKGKALVDAARIKADINKIEKISTALTVFYSKFDHIPGIGGGDSFGSTTGLWKLADGSYAGDGSSAAVYQNLLNEGLLKESDFMTSEKTYWAFIGCSPADGSFAPAKIDGNNNICIYRTSKTPIFAQLQASLTALLDPTYSNDSICQIETLLDDKNLSAGDGRIIGTFPSNFDNSSWNCADKTKYPTTTGTVSYVHRVF